MPCPTLRSRLRLTTLLLSVLVGVAGSGTSLHAQRESAASVSAPSVPAVTTPTTSSPAAAATVPLGPRLTRAGIDPRATADSAAPLVPQEGRHLGAGTNIALMSVGAAAVVVGLVIGGDGGTLIAISGGVLGLVGLFRYIR